MFLQPAQSNLVGELVKGAPDVILAWRDVITIYSGLQQLGHDRAHTGERIFDFSRLPQADVFLDLVAVGLLNLVDRPLGNQPVILVQPLFKGPVLQIGYQRGFLTGTQVVAEIKIAKFKIPVLIFIDDLKKSFIVIAF